MKLKREDPRQSVSTALRVPKIRRQSAPATRPQSVHHTTGTQPRLAQVARHGTKAYCSQSAASLLDSLRISRRPCNVRVFSDNRRFPLLFIARTKQFNAAALCVLYSVCLQLIILRSTSAVITFYVQVRFCQFVSKRL